MAFHVLIKAASALSRGTQTLLPCAADAYRFDARVGSLWPRRRLETLTMYLSLSNNPFRWMYIHIASHHIARHITDPYSREFLAGISDAVSVRSPAAHTPERDPLFDADPWAAGLGNF